MTYPAGVVTEALPLADAGRSATVIARLIGVPRSTVRHWLEVAVPRGRLGVNDTCDACGHAPHEPDDLPPAYLYLLGVYLGDGCTSTHPRAVYRLRVFLDARYPGIVAEVSEAMAAVRPRNAVGCVTRRSGFAPRTDGTVSSVEVYSYSRSWPCLIPQFGPGRKHERAIALSDWQRELVRRDPRPLLRGLIHSDGCRFVNTGSGGWSNPRYSFTNRSADIRRIYCDACDLAGVRWTVATDTIYVSRKADVARMDEFVGPKA